MQFRCVPVHPVLRYVTGPAEAELAWAFAGPAAGGGGGGCLDVSLARLSLLLTSSYKPTVLMTPQQAVLTPLAGSKS